MSNSQGDMEEKSIDEAQIEGPLGLGLGSYNQDDAYGAPKDLLPQDREDLEAIIESISYGKTQ